MQLTSLAALQSAIGFDPGVQEDVLNAAIEAGAETLMGLLQTELDQAAIVDQYYVLPNACYPLGRCDWRTKLALSRGFVNGAVTLVYGDDLSSLDTSVTTTVFTDPEKGGVTITGVDLRHRYVQASYTAGFAVDPNDATLYTGLPAWLSDVALLAAMAALDLNSPLTRFEDAKVATQSAQALTQQVQTRISNRLRYFPNSLRPIG